MITEIKKVNKLFMGLVSTFIFGTLAINFAWVYLEVLFLIPLKYNIVIKGLLTYFPTIVMLGFGGYYFLKNKISLKNDLRFKPISPLVVLLLVIMSFVMMPMVSFVNAVSMMFVTNLVENALDEFTKNGLLYAIFTVAVLPAFTEEFIYRGVIGQTYIKANWKKGVLLSSFLFGIMHANFNQFSYAFVLGILFMLVLEATDSIYATMILHFIINGFNVALAFLIKQLNISKFLEGELQKAMEESQEITWNTIASLIVPAIISFIGFCLLLVLIAKITGRYQILSNKIKGKKIENTSKDQEFNIESVKTKLWSWHLTVGVIICLIVAILTEVQMRKWG